MRGKDLILGGGHNAIYRWFITKLCMWSLHKVVNQYYLINFIKENIHAQMLKKRKNVLGAYSSLSEVIKIPLNLERRDLFHMAKKCHSATVCYWPE